MKMADTEQQTYKQCAHCNQRKPIGEFLRRTGRRSGADSRRGACRSCRKLRKAAVSGAAAVQTAPPKAESAPPSAEKKRPRVKAPVRPSKPRTQPKATPHSPTDFTFLRPTRQGTVWMRGKTDKGRRWHQEIDLGLAETLVKERAAVVVNRHTIRRLFSNKDFRKYILTRDSYTCYFCGEYGDTIDHMLPRAKGGHTTPDNCVCACNECNQSKADKDLEEFMREV
ncbi:HNH endonuclease [Paenibacillus sp. NPDC058071]|uniref:HNH endonuclease n=1 Tax=Paenibacillus sp. NPDC058071 TaxID=3346326 RepID=UPI0036DEBB73